MSAKKRLFSRLLRAGESSRASKYALESAGERIFLRDLRTTPDDTERDFSGKQAFEGVVGLNPSPSTDGNEVFLFEPTDSESRVRSAYACGTRVRLGTDKV
jgi:hypothetical protein